MNLNPLLGTPLDQKYIGLAKLFTRFAKTLMSIA